MAHRPVILGLGRADATGLVGSGGVDVTWAALDTEPGGTGRLFKQLFGSAHPNFRRFDRSARLLVMACEASGLGSVVAPAEREDTVLLVETERGCLETDRRFTDSLGQEMVDSGAFPYTLSNTCLGEVAIRHGLRGSTLCLSVGPGEDGEALAEALRLFEAGETTHAVVGRVECLATATAGLEPSLVAVAAVLGWQPDDSRAVTPWPALEGDVFAELAGRLAPAGGGAAG